MFDEKKYEEIQNKNKSRLKQTMSKACEIKVKATISYESKKKFKEDIEKIPHIDKTVNYIIVEIFLQLGSPSRENPKLLDYQKPSDITLFIQPKIKNYITFKAKENALEYIENEFDKDTLYALLEVNDGRIYLPYHID